MRSTNSWGFGLLAALLVAACGGDDTGGAAEADISDGAVASDTAADDTAADDTAADHDTGSTAADHDADPVDPHGTDTEAEEPDAETAGPADTVGGVDSDGGPVEDTAPAADAASDAPAPTPDMQPTDDVAPLDPATVPLRGACELPVRLGGFVVEVQPEQSIIDGKVGHVVNPITVLDEVGSEGPCRLLQKEFPFCDPLCPASTTCAKGGVCVEFPAPQDLGTVTIEGLVEPIVLEPLVPGYLYFDTTLPQPVFEPGVAARLTSTEGWAGELELFGIGSTPLDLDFDELVVQEGSDLDLTWDAPEGEVRSHVHVRLNIDQHGTSPVIVTCEFPDTGAASIPASLIDALLDFGVSGFPNATISRRTADQVEIDAGCIDLVLGTPVTPSVDVSGHHPCSSTADCPGGLTCDVAIETCK